MYPLQQHHRTSLQPSASYPGGVPTPPTSRILAPESEGHYPPPPLPPLSQLYFLTPSPLRSEAEFARLERLNRELKQALERAEKAERLQRFQSEFREISSSSVVAAAPPPPPPPQPLFYPSCSPAAAAACSSRSGDNLGRSPFGTHQQQHQRQQSRPSYQGHQHTYLDHEKEYDGDDDNDDSTPLLSGRAKRQRLEDPPQVTRDLAMVNLDHIRFQHQGQVHHAMVRSRGVTTDLYKDAPSVPSVGGVSSSNNNSTHSSVINRNGTHIQSILLHGSFDAFDASEKARTRPLDPSLYFADSVISTPNRSGSSSPALAFVAPPNFKRVRGTQQPSQRPAKLASLIDAGTLPLLPEQGGDIVNNAITLNSSAPPGHPGPYLRMHHQHAHHQYAHQPQETSSVNPQDLMKGNQSKCAPPTASTTPSPFHSKLRAISATSNKSHLPAPSSASASKATNTSNESNATFVSKKAKAHVDFPHYEQERTRAKEKTDRLVLKFKTRPARTNGTSSNKKSLKGSKVIKTEDPQMPPPYPNARYCRSTTTTAIPKSELEMELEPEGNSRGPGHKNGKLTGRWVVDAVVIPIPRWYRGRIRD